VEDLEIFDKLLHSHTFRFGVFGEAIRVAQDHMDSQNFYGWNPSFDKQKNNKCGISSCD